MIALILTPELTGALVEVVGAALVLVASIWVMPWLRARALTAKSEMGRKLYTDALAKLDAAIVPAVYATEQTVAGHLRASAPSAGMLTTDQAATAMGDAVSRVATQLGGERLDAIAEAMGFTHAQLDEVIRTRIEAAILELKHRTAESAP